MAAGFQASGKTFKVHLDGYNFMPYFQGKVQKGPRERMFYFDQGGNLNAVRWNDWKVSFAISSEGNIATALRETPSWAMITNLRMDPYERGIKEGGKSLEFFAQQMWLLVPIQAQIKEFFSDFDKYPYQMGSSLNASGIGYGMLRQQDALKRLKELESMSPR
jgi:arylsulfatase